MIISSQICSSKLESSFTSGAGCWLPTSSLDAEHLHPGPRAHLTQTCPRLVAKRPLQRLDMKGKGVSEQGPRPLRASGVGLDPLEPRFLPLRASIRGPISPWSRKRLRAHFWYPFPLSLERLRTQFWYAFPHLSKDWAFTAMAPLQKGLQATCWSCCEGMNLLSHQVVSCHSKTWDRHIPLTQK